ncbi:Transglutaminase-like protein, putative cysteine protease [Clostridiaceae bacterium JG1575]|nr:Transglutaminase-like protein, putative cysteine protease [Clostridiaceae bacterium JG1575]
MDWIKKNAGVFILLGLHPLVVAQRILSSYNAPVASPFLYYARLFLASLAVAFVAKGLLEAVQRKNLRPLGLALCGALLLMLTMPGGPSMLEGIAAINETLAQRRAPTGEAFQGLLFALTVALSFMSWLSLPLLPYNLILLDLAVLVFLYEAGFLKGMPRAVIPLALFWLLALIVGRIQEAFSRREVLGARCIQRGMVLRQGALAFLLGAAFSLPLWSSAPGHFRDEIDERIAIWREGARLQDFLDDHQAYSLARSGYPDSSEHLGGDLQFDETEAFFVEGEAPLYLRGSVRTIYTGSGWKKTPFQKKAEEGLSPATRQLYGAAPQKTYRVLPKNLFTTSLFVGLYTEKTKVANRWGNIPTFYSPHTQEYQANRPLRQPYEITYFDEKAVQAAHPQGILAAPDSFEDFLNLPETVTPRTRSLVQKITKNARSSQEIMASLVGYLQENQKYSLTPGPLPDEGDAVDYFLFDQKEGYCTYFATALTVMARIAGVPARYVEGFVQSDEQNASGQKILRNSQAHAWCEVLLEPSGTLWKIYDASGSAQRQIVSGDPGRPNPLPAQEAGPEETVPRPLRPRPESPSSTGGAAPEEPLRPQDPPRRMPWHPLTVVAVLGSIWGIGLLLLWGIRRRLRVQLLDPEAKALERQILHWLTEGESEKWSGKTLLEHAQLLPEGALREEFIRFSKDLNAVRFGHKAPSYNLAQRKQLRLKILTQTLAPKHPLKAATLRWFLS